MIYEYGHNIDISNPFIAYYGKKRDLQIYVTAKQHRASEMNGDSNEQEPLIYHVLVNHNNEFGNSFLPLALGNLGTNISVSEGLIISF